MRARGESRGLRGTMTGRWRGMTRARRDDSSFGITIAESTNLSKSGRSGPRERECVVRKQTDAKWRKRDLECRVVAGVEVRLPGWKICRCRDKNLGGGRKIQNAQEGRRDSLYNRTCRSKPAPHCDASGLARVANATLTQTSVTCSLL